MTDHLLQSTAFAVCVAALAWGFRRHRAGVRYALWFSASAKFLVPFSLFMSLGRHAEPVVAPLAPAMAAAAGPLAAPFRATVLASGTPEPSGWAAWILAAWACGALAVVATRVRGWLQIRRMARVSRRHPMPFPIEVRTLPGALEPGLVGLWRCTLLLPEGIERCLTPRQLDAVLEHELCHARRRDNALAAAHMLVETLFWFHPAVWWIGARLAETRELACDEAVIARGGDPAEYAEAILNVCRRYVASPLACVSGMTGADLKKRIGAVLSRRPAVPLGWRKKAALCAAAALAALLPFLGGVIKAQALKAFEVASIRPAPDAPRFLGGGWLPPTIRGGQFRYTGSVHRLLDDAFRLRDCKSCDFVAGGPAWIRQDPYQITAKLPEGTPRYGMAEYQAGKADEIYQMVRSLLEERFRLRAHRETRNIPAYLLTVAPGGHKLQPPTGKTMTFDDGVERLDEIFSIMPLGGKKVFEATAFRISAPNYSLAGLADSLSSLLDRPVVDRTGLSGRFSGPVDCETDPEEPRRMPPDLNNPSLFKALRQQLGLRLEAGSAPFEFLVIDSIEHPTAN
jgi:bla regulator protein blaR1